MVPCYWRKVIKYKRDSVTYKGPETSWDFRPMEDNSTITPGIGICNRSLDSKDALHNSKRGIESFLRGATLVLAVTNLNKWP